MSSERPVPACPKHFLSLFLQQIVTSILSPPLPLCDTRTGPPDADRVRSELLQLHIDLSCPVHLWDDRLRGARPVQTQALLHRSVPRRGRTRDLHALHVQWRRPSVRHHVPGDGSPTRCSRWTCHREDSRGWCVDAEVRERHRRCVERKHADGNSDLGVCLMQPPFLAVAWPHTLLIVPSLLPGQTCSARARSERFR